MPEAGDDRFARRQIGKMDGGRRLTGPHLRAEIRKRLNNLFNCYDAILVGTAGYHLTVAEAGSGKRREIHTTADSWTMAKVAMWTAGDELVVCNAMVTNKSKGVGARCGDFEWLFSEFSFWQKEILKLPHRLRELPTRISKESPEIRDPGFSPDAWISANEAGPAY
jgi:hypothetical protein